MSFHPRICPVLLLFTVFLASSLAATPLRQAYDLQGPGLTLAQAGTGLVGLGGGARTLTLDVGGPVELALLYWAGREHPCQLNVVSGECSVPAEPSIRAFFPATRLPKTISPSAEPTTPGPE